MSIYEGIADGPAPPAPAPAPAPSGGGIAMQSMGSPGSVFEAPAGGGGAVGPGFVQVVKAYQDGSKDFMKYPQLVQVLMILIIFVGLFVGPLMLNWQYTDDDTGRWWQRAIIWVIMWMMVLVGTVQWYAPDIMGTASPPKCTRDMARPWLMMLGWLVFCMDILALGILGYRDLDFWDFLQVTVINVFVCAFGVGATILGEYCGVPSPLRTTPTEKRCGLCGLTSFVLLFLLLWFYDALAYDVEKFEACEDTPEGCFPPDTPGAPVVNGHVGEISCKGQYYNPGIPDQFAISQAEQDTCLPHLEHLVSDSNNGWAMCIPQEVETSTGTVATCDSSFGDCAFSCRSGRVVVLPFAMNFTESECLCRAFGGNLASIGDEEDYQALNTAVMQANPDHPVWLGAHKPQGQDSVWMWTDHSSAAIDDAFLETQGLTLTTDQADKDQLVYCGTSCASKTGLGAGLHHRAASNLDAGSLVSPACFFPNSPLLGG